MKRILTAGLIVLIASLFLSCDIVRSVPSDATAPVAVDEEAAARARLSAAEIVKPVIEAYVESGRASVIGESAQDLGSGIIAEIPDLSFASEEDERSFYDECEALLAATMGDDYAYVCEPISPAPVPEGARYTTLIDQNIGEDKIGPDMGPARVLVRRHWVLKYYLTLEVDQLDDQCAYLYVYLRTNKGDTATASATYDKNCKVKSDEYKGSSGGKSLSAANSYVIIRDPTVPGGEWRHDFSTGASQPGPTAYAYYDSSLSGSHSFTMRHVYYKNASGDWTWNAGIDGYAHFKNNLTENNDIKHLFLGYLSNPALTANVTNFVLCIAGQQGSQMDSTAVPSVVTGQYDNWHDNGGIADEWRPIVTKSITLNKSSMAGQIFQDMATNGGGRFGFTPANTFLGVVLDSTFYYDLPSSRKDELEKAFAEWLLSQTSNLAGVKNIYLVGASMGGGLAVRVAEYIRDDYANKSQLAGAKIVVSCMDGVGNTGVDIGIVKDSVSSPYTLLGNKCWKADLPGYFANETNTHVYQISGGDAVVDIVSDARGFYVPNSGSFTQFTWVSLSHLQIGRFYLCPNLMDLQMKWFVKNRKP